MKRHYPYTAEGNRQWVNDKFFEKFGLEGQLSVSIEAANIVKAMRAEAAATGEPLEILVMRRELGI